MASAMPDLWLPTQLMPVLIYTAYLQRHVYMNNLPRVAPKSVATGSRVDSLQSLEEVRAQVPKAGFVQILESPGM